MFFDKESINAQIGYPGRRRAMRVVNWIVRQITNGDWLMRQDAFIKERALALLLIDPAQFINVLRLVSLTPSHSLPHPGDVPACIQYLSAIFQTQRADVHHDLRERSAGIREVDIGLYASKLNQDQIYANLTSNKATARHQGIRTIRAVDKTYSPHQSLVYAPIIRRNRVALEYLVHMASPCTAVFSLERGGALWGEYIGLMTSGGIDSIKLPKPKKNPTRVFIDNIKKYIDVWQGENSGNAQARLTIGIAETMVSGGSANRVLDAAKAIARGYTNVDLKLLFARHTQHRDNDRLLEFHNLKLKDERALYLFDDRDDEFLSLPEIANTGSEVEMFIANARYLLGEDIDYQLKYNGQSADKPLVVFDKINGELKAVCIDPSRGHTARELLIRLILGCYDDTLEELGFRL